jgi:hypothetical protein
MRAVFAGVSRLNKVGISGAADVVGNLRDSVTGTGASLRLISRRRPPVRLEETAVTKKNKITRSWRNVGILIVSQECGGGGGTGEAWQTYQSPGSGCFK